MSGHRIYRWRSNAVRQYAQGHLVAIGLTPDEARCRVRIEARQWIKTENGKPHLDDRDGDDREDIAEFFASLDCDLGREPEVADALIIWGSE